MYSPGVYVVLLQEEDDQHKYFCLADPTCQKTTTIPCKTGDRSNVNTLHETKHRLHGVAGVVKAGNQKQSWFSSVGNIYQ